MTLLQAFELGFAFGVSLMGLGVKLHLDRMGRGIRP
jgi:hypothetical protein